MIFISKLIKKLRNNDKGASSIEVAIGGIILIMLLAFLVDLLLIGWKFSVASQTSTFLARTVGIQGGLLGASPEGYEAGNYLTSSNMTASVGSKLNTAGIANDKWKLSVNGTTMTSSGNGSSKVDYLQDAETSITIKYRWIVGTFIPPLAGDKEFVSKRIVTSEWNYDWDDWNGKQ